MNRKNKATVSGVKTLKRLLLDKARTCVHQPAGMLAFRFTTPSYGVEAGADDNAALPERSSVGHYLQMYDWDACWFAQAAPRAGIKGLALDVVGNFLALQREDGFIPRTVSPNQIWDEGDLCKPFLAQTLFGELSNVAADIGAIKGMLAGIERHLQYFRKHRYNEAKGLFFWRNVLESGVDNNLALIGPHEAAKDEDQTVVRFPDGRLLAVDLNSYLVAEHRALGMLLGLAGDSSAKEEHLRFADELAARIEDLLFDEDLELYVNVDPSTNERVRLRCWTGFTPVLFGVSSAERARQVIESNCLNEEHFLRPFGIASVAASELLSNQSPRGLYGRAIVCNWQGPVWILPNALLARTLVKLGYVDAAKDIASRVVSAMVHDLNETGVLHENYNADTGQSLWAPQFMSWNILALELVELLEKRPARKPAAVRS